MKMYSQEQLREMNVKVKESKVQESMIRVLVVDDRPSIRQGLQMRFALEPDLLVVGEAGDGETALALTQQLRPDVVVMDVEMPHMDGVQATREVRTTAPASAVVMLSIHEDSTTRARCHAAGAAAFVTKKQSPETLLSAIRQVAASAACAA
jgi:DNA-binding NarL/FixJ family response regulator